MSQEHLYKRLEDIKEYIKSIYSESLDAILQGYLERFYRILWLHFSIKTPDTLVPTKGSIYFVELGTNIGTELNKKRPCIIWSNKMYNGGGTVIVLPIKGLYGKENEFTITIKPNQENCLEKDSRIAIADIRTVSKKRIQGYVGKIDGEMMYKIDQKLINILGIKK